MLTSRYCMGVGGGGGLLLSGFDRKVKTFCYTFGEPLFSEFYGSDIFNEKITCCFKYHC